MRTFHSAAIVLAVQVALVLGSCSEAPEVIQGTVVSFDTAANALTIRDECPPHAEITLSVESAEIGAAPERDDVVRAAFRIEGDHHKATRVMNLTRQKEIGLASGTGSTTRCPPQER
jgi:hypothetical protein